MIQSWPLSVFFFNRPPNDKLLVQTRSWKVFQKIMCVQHYLKKVGKMQVKIYSTELQLCISHLAWKGNIVVKQPSSNLPIIFGSRLSAIVNLFWNFLEKVWRGQEAKTTCQLNPLTFLAQLVAAAHTLSSSPSSSYKHLGWLGHSYVPRRTALRFPEAIVLPESRCYTTSHA